MEVPLWGWHAVLAAILVMLAVDNVFVFALIVSYVAVPREYQHRVLFCGMVGALVFRAIFIAGGAALLDQFGWVLYVFGAFLLVTGWRRYRHRGDDPTSSATSSSAWCAGGCGRPTGMSVSGSGSAR